MFMETARFRHRLGPGEGREPGWSAREAAEEPSAGGDTGGDGEQKCRAVEQVVRRRADQQPRRASTSYDMGLRWLTTWSQPGMSATG
jgi:hypothetical protein